MAHPDDEADVGGTIFKLAKNGNEIAVAILVGKVQARRNLSATLTQEEQLSMNLLGVKKVYHADFPNIKTNVVPHLELVQFIESCIEDWQAEAIVTHHSADVNIDHALTSTASIAACRLFQRKTGIPQLQTCLKSLTMAFELIKAWLVWRNGFGILKKRKVHITTTKKTRRHMSICLSTGMNTSNKKVIG